MKADQVLRELMVLALAALIPLSVHGKGCSTISECDDVGGKVVVCGCPDSMASTVCIQPGGIFKGGICYIVTDSGTTCSGRGGPAGDPTGFQEECPAGEACISQPGTTLFRSCVKAAPVDPPPPGPPGPSVSPSTLPSSPTTSASPPSTTPETPTTTGAPPGTTSSPSSSAPSSAVPTTTSPPTDRPGPTTVPSSALPSVGPPPGPSECGPGQLPVSVEGGSTGCAAIPICVGGFPEGNCPDGSRCGIVKTGVPGCVPSK